MQPPKVSTEPLCCSELAWQAAPSIAKGHGYALLRARTTTHSLHDHMYGVYNIIYRVCTDATKAQRGISPFFGAGERVRVKRVRQRWGRSCALACVIIRAETIECTQNAEWEISRAANSDCKYGIPLTACFTASVMCKKNKISLCSVQNEICKTTFLKFRVRLGRFCFISIFYENVDGMRPHLALSIVGLETMWLFLDHTRTKETRGLMCSRYRQLCISGL